MRRDVAWPLLALALATGAVLGLVRLLHHPAVAAPQIAQLQVSILGAPSPGAHDICVFAAYRDDGVALPAFERSACDSVYQRVYSQADRRVSARAQAHADSLCFQFRTHVAGLRFQNPACTGARPEHTWHITMDAKGQVVAP